MILSDTQIIKRIESGEIVISPFDRKYINPCSIDLTLAPSFKIYKQLYERGTVIPEWVSECDPIYSQLDEVGFTDKGSTIYQWVKPLDCRSENPTEEITMPEEGFVLVPGNVYLYCVNEKIGVKGNIRAKVEGKSSLGRLGLFVHVTAGFVDPGFEGSLVLELVATRPIKVYPNMKICQVEFAEVTNDIGELYGDKEGSKYQNQEDVQASKYHENFNQSNNK